MVQNSSADQSSQPTTHLFTVRLWQAPTSDGPSEIRGKVQHVLSGEVRYFGDWLDLQDFLMQQSDEMQDPTSE